MVKPLCWKFNKTVVAVKREAVGMSLCVAWLSMRFAQTVDLLKFSRKGIPRVHRKSMAVSCVEENATCGVNKEKHKT